MSRAQTDGKGALAHRTRSIAVYNGRIEEEIPMKQLALALAVLALTVTAAGAQQEKNLPTMLMNIEAGDVEVRYLNFKWDEKAFEALEKGGGAPAAARSWALARILTPKPITIEGKPVGGGALLILNPASGSDPMTLEIRMVDMRDVFTDVNVIAEPPAGQTIYKATADFETVDALADRLTMKLEEAGETMKLSIHYGNRLKVLEAKR
jgi:hypothetical protein